MTHRPYESLTSASKELIQDVDKDYLLWSICRSVYVFDEDGGEISMILLNFTATESLLQDPCEFGITTTSFIPILPYKATEIDTVCSGRPGYEF